MSREGPAAEGAPDLGARARRFAATWSAVAAELDWGLLGRLHCHTGGDDFFAGEARTALVDAGLLFADDLGRTLAPGGRSLYIGASVAELIPMLAEGLVLEREVLWYQLAGPLTAELDRALAAVAEAESVALPRARTSPLAEVAASSCDHLWLVSVLTDPDAFPALHDRLYERSDELATRRGDLADDRARADALLARALRCLRAPGWLTTTDEELRLVRPACAERGLALAVPAHGRLSAVVGDVVRACRVT